MGTITKIQWADHTASPWHGCERATLPDGTPHPGCLNCYAEAMSGRNPGTLGTWGPSTKGGKRIVSANFHANCLAWNRKAQREATRRSVFPSICDPFENWQGDLFDHRGSRLWFNRRHGEIEYQAMPYRTDQYFHKANCRLLTMQDVRNQIFTGTIDHCPDLDFYLLTKRPEHIRPFWPAREPLPGTTTQHFGPLEEHRDNVFLLYSASDQPSHDAGIASLLTCRDLCPVLGLSLEPLLGPVEFSDVTKRTDAVAQLGKQALTGINWVIVGCESIGSQKRVGRLPEGGEAAYWHIAAELHNQCRAAGVPFYHKQGPVNGLASGDPTTWPIKLPREFPEVHS